MFWSLGYNILSIISSEAKIFVIRCSINQAIQIPKISHIIVITDSIYVANQIFDLIIHLYQHQSIIISKYLWLFFNKHSLNSVKFWNCPSNSNWSLYTLVDKETKNLILHHYFYTKHHGILTRSRNAIIS